jgi:hypothetical protein
MEYAQSRAMWIAMNSIMASSRERGAVVQANTSQPEEGFVPFHLPPVKPQPAVEAQPPVAVPRSKAMPIAV